MTRHPSLHTDGQALAGVFIDHCEQTQLSPVTCRLAHEVIGPDVVSVLGPQTNAGTIGQPQSASLWLPGRHLESFGPPDALHPFGVHLPAGHLQKIGDAPVAVAAEAARQGDNSRGQGVLIGSHLELVTLAGAMLTKSPAGPAFRDV